MYLISALLSWSWTDHLCHAMHGYGMLQRRTNRSLTFQMRISFSFLETRILYYQGRRRQPNNFIRGMSWTNSDVTILGFKALSQGKAEKVNNQVTVGGLDGYWCGYPDLSGARRLFRSSKRQCRGSKSMAMVLGFSASSKKNQQPNPASGFQRSSIWAVTS